MKTRRWITRIWPIVPIFAALIVTSALLVLFGAKPGESFQAMFQGSFGDQSKSLSVLAFWVPLLLSAFGLLVTFTAGLWNIGVEGQIVMGAIAASWVALRLNAPAPVMIALEVMMAMAAGALWGGLSAILKTRGRVHEIFIS